MKICVISSTRADFGFLRGVLELLNQNSSVDLRLLVTGSHLSHEHGNTISEIENEGFKVHKKIQIDMKDDSSDGIALAIAQTLMGFSKEFKSIQPDWVILLGDRYEIFAAAQAAYVHKLPIAHLGGGDVTEGAMDEATRHCISKMSQLHFVSHQAAKSRLERMGEHPSTVHAVGSTTIDALLKVPLLTPSQFYNEIQFKPGKLNFLVTYHPETLSNHNSGMQINELLLALDEFKDEAHVIITRPNADEGNRNINSLIDSFVSSRPWTKAFQSLGQKLYVNALVQCDVVIGNSSSGLYEAPTFKIPTVNIGDRQKGRILAKSVIQCSGNRNEIVSSIKKALELNCESVENPYGTGNASQKIVDLLLKIDNPKSLLKKKFYQGEIE